jgi:hypothetical protein
MTTDDWVQSALTDDTIVVHLLFKLKQASPSPSPSTPPVLPPSGWGHRHARSKPGTSGKKEARYSPTTPLSWSAAAASASDDYEDASHPCRSKGIFANESTVATSNNKISRKRKTYNQLKEEESLLLKERTHLKKELASVRSSVKVEKSRSESLKRVEMNHNRPILQRLKASTSSSSSSLRKQKQVESKECFFLPDLNMPPCEDESSR